MTKKITEKSALASNSSRYCSMPEVIERIFDLNVTPNRVRLIRESAKKWVNGTTLHYYFFDKSTDGENVTFSDGSKKWITWTTTETEKNVVREAFKKWKDVGIGIEFKEVSKRQDAEVRIGFMRGDGAWSYIGRDILAHGPDERTMNFGWDLTRPVSEIDTAIHEIGHTLGFPHEHQNPNAGIVWDEEAVYHSLAQPPNSWSRQNTYWNIIRKIAADTVQGSSWDPNSIMHYPFEAGLIKEPAQYRNGLNPAGGLSARDLTWVRTFYPPLTDADYADLEPLVSIQLSLEAGQQKNFHIKPTVSRKYEIKTFGTSDAVIVLFEEENGELKYIGGDDDSGEDRNAYMKLKLLSGHKYLLRIRLYYVERRGETAVMLW
jgi:hypothetical protein